MTKFWPLALLLACLPGRVAFAEAQPLTTYVGGPFSVYIKRPTVALDGRRIDCGPAQPDCFLLNRAACDANGPALPISFTISGTSAGVSVDASQTRTVYAFLSTTSSCIYSQVAGQTGNNPNMLIGSVGALPSGSVFFAGGTRPFTFPQDLSTFNEAVTDAASTGEFTTREMMRALGLCEDDGGTATNLSTYFLCLGVDSSNKGGVNSATNVASASSPVASLTGGATTGGSSDPTAYLQLQMDTRAPEVPTSLSVTPRNGRAEATVKVDTSLLDVYQINLSYTANPEDLAAGDALDGNNQPLGCAAWSREVGRKSINVYNQVGGSASFDVGGLKNDVVHGFCASAQDRLGNVGTPTAVQLALPRFECDLFECYPGELATGYCGAGATGELAGAAGLVALALRWRRRRRDAGSVGRRPRARPGVAVWAAFAAMGVSLAATVARAESPAWEDAERNRPRSEPPTGTARQRPRSVESDDPESTERRRGHFRPTYDPMHESLDYAPRGPRTPRWGAELRLAPYRPRVGDAAVRQVYDLVYAKNDGSIVHGRPMSYAVAGEWYAFRGLGLVGPYLRVGYWRAAGRTRQCNDAAGKPVPCTAATVLASTRGNDTGSLTMLPVTPGVVWRLDPLLARLKLPMGAALNVGLDYVLWWARSGGRPARYGAHRAQGATLGLHVGAQVSLQLDALMHRGAGTSRTVAGTHLFAEYQYSYGAALLGRHRRAHLDTTDRAMLALGLGLRFY